MPEPTTCAKAGTTRSSTWQDMPIRLWRVIEWWQKEEATVRTIIQQDAVANPPVKRTQQRHVQLQERLQNLCRDFTTGQKTIAEFLCGVGWNIRLNHQHQCLGDN